MNTYWKGVLQETVEIFRKWVNELSGKVLKKDVVEHWVWVVPVPYCAVRYINNASYWLGDTKQERKRVINPGKLNVQLFQWVSTIIPKILESLDFIVLIRYATSLSVRSG